MTSEPLPIFTTAAGRAAPSVTADQMREIDRIAVEETGPSLLQMMEHAGRSAATVALDLLPGVPPEARILVLAGAGGNGGGGIAAARHLVGRAAEVVLGLLAPDRLGEAAAYQLATYRHTGGALSPSLEGLRDEEPFDLILDAMVGYGLRGRPREPVASAIRRTNESRARVLALDLPSGLTADTGAAPRDSVQAQATLTLHLPKPGLVEESAGDLYLADLGIPGKATRRIGIDPAEFGSSFVVPLTRPEAEAANSPEGHR